MRLLGKLRSVGTMRDVGLAAVGVAVGSSLLFDLGLPDWVVPAGFLLVGVASVLFIVGKKRV